MIFDNDGDKVQSMNMNDIAETILFYLKRAGQNNPLHLYHFGYFIKNEDNEVFFVENTFKKNNSSAEPCIDDSRTEVLSRVRVLEEKIEKLERKQE